VIVPPHPAIRAVFAAKVGHFHHATNENPAAKVGRANGGGASVEHRLGFAAQLQQLGAYRE
jgi:hypothetical protein